MPSFLSDSSDPFGFDGSPRSADEFRIQQVFRDLISSLDRQNFSNPDYYLHDELIKYNPELLSKDKLYATAVNYFLPKHLKALEHAYFSDDPLRRRSYYRLHPASDVVTERLAPLSDDDIGFTAGTLLQYLDALQHQYGLYRKMLSKAHSAAIPVNLYEMQKNHLLTNFVAPYIDAFRMIQMAPSLATSLQSVRRHASSPDSVRDAIDGILADQFPNLKEFSKYYELIPEMREGRVFDDFAQEIYGGEVYYERDLGDVFYNISKRLAALGRPASGKDFLEELEKELEDFYGKGDHFSRRLYYVPVQHIYQTSKNFHDMMQSLNPDAERLRQTPLPASAALGAALAASTTPAAAPAVAALTAAADPTLPPLPEPPPPVQSSPWLRHGRYLAGLALLAALIATGYGLNRYYAKKRKQKERLLPQVATG